MNSDSPALFSSVDFNGSKTKAPAPHSLFPHCCIRDSLLPAQDPVALDSVSWVHGVLGRDRKPKC